MNKNLLFFTFSLIAGFLFNSCTVTIPSESFDDRVATQAAVVFTATALAEYFANPTETPQPQAGATNQPSPEPTVTLSAEDPVKSLNLPTAKDDLSGSSIWFKNSNSFSNEFATFSAGSGVISALSKKSGGPIWYDYFEKRPQNLYLEGKLKANACAGNDSYGILFRGKDIGEGSNYFFAVKCNGNYELFRFGISSSISYLVSNKSDSAINTGSGATNTLGVWAKDSRIRLYVNGKFLEEIEDDALLNDGYVGFFIWSVNGAGLSVDLDEIAYWAIN